MSVYFRLRNTEISAIAMEKIFFAADEMFLAVDEIVFAGILLFLPLPKCFRSRMECF
jgi:hypothetical protein